MIIRRVVLSSGAVDTVVGRPGTLGFADGQGTNALFNNPFGIALDYTGSFALIVRFLFNVFLHFYTLRQV